MFNTYNLKCVLVEGAPGIGKSTESGAPGIGKSTESGPKVSYNLVVPL